MELQPGSCVDQARAMRPNSNVLWVCALSVFTRTKPNRTTFAVGRRLLRCALLALLLLLYQEGLFSLRC